MAKQQRQSTGEKAAELVMEQARRNQTLNIEQTIAIAKMAAELGMTAPAPRHPPICSFDATLSPGGRITIPLATMKMAGLSPGMILRIEVTNTMSPEPDTPIATPVDIRERAELRGGLRHLLKIVSMLDPDRRDALMPEREILMEYLRTLEHKVSEEQLKEISTYYKEKLRPEVERIALTDNYGKRLTASAQKEAKRKK